MAGNAAAYVRAVAPGFIPGEARAIAPTEAAGHKARRTKHKSVLRGGLPRPPRTGPKRRTWWPGKATTREL
jgi:hypothetical protein